MLYLSHFFFVLYFLFLLYTIHAIHFPLELQIGVFRKRLEIILKYKGLKFCKIRAGGGEGGRKSRFLVHISIKIKVFHALNTWSGIFCNIFTKWSGSEENIIVSMWKDREISIFFFVYILLQEEKLIYFKLFMNVLSSNELGISIKIIITWGS